MPSVYFHDLPIYRLPRDAYYAGRDKYVADFVADTFCHGSPSPEAVKNLSESMKQHDYDTYGPWRFNEIIGYIRLHFLGSQVRGEYFAVNRSRHVLTRHKTFVYRTHKLAPEHQVPRDATSNQILQVIHEYVEACRKEVPRRYIDDSWLQAVGPFVDWNAVIKLGWGPRA
jgi:hypothetical protein